MESVHGVDVSWLHHPNKGETLLRLPLPLRLPQPRGETFYMTEHH